MADSAARMEIVPLTQSQARLRPSLTSTIPKAGSTQRPYHTQTNARILRKDTVNAGARLSAESARDLTWQGVNEKDQTLMYIITSTYDYSCIEMLEEETEWGESAGNLLCLSGWSAETSPRAEKTNKIALICFCLCSQERKCQKGMVPSQYSQQIPTAGRHTHTLWLTLIGSSTFTAAWLRSFLLVTR